MQVKYGQTLRQAISVAASSDCIVDLNGTNVWIAERIDIPAGVRIINGAIKFSGAASLVLIEDSSALEDIYVYSQGYSSNDPIIELVNTRNASLKRVKVDGFNNRKSVLCRTKAYDTVIDDLDILGDLGWGLLFNDSVQEQGADYRIFDTKNYRDEPLGSGLTISNYKFGNMNSKRAGDGLEINCPDHGFSNITINGVEIRKTNATTANGIGVGIANCTGVRAKNINVRNAALSGIHFEKGGDHIVEDFYIENAKRAISIGHTDGTTFRKGECVNSGKWLTAYNTLPTKPAAANCVLEDVTFRGCSENGIMIANAEKFILRRVKLEGYCGSETGSLIKLYQEHPELPGVTNSLIEDLQISSVDGTTKPDTLINVENSPGNKIKNIFVEGYDRTIKVDGNIIQV